MNSLISIKKSQFFKLIKNLNINNNIGNKNGEI